MGEAKALTSMPIRLLVEHQHSVLYLEIQKRIHKTVTQIRITCEQPSRLVDMQIFPENY